MNILFVFYLPIVPHIGGVQRVTETLAVEMKRRGHNVYYLSIYEAEDIGYSFPVPQFYLNYLQGEAESKKAYLDILERYDIHAVICQEPRVDLMNILSATPDGIRRITCYHCRPFYDQQYIRQVMRFYNPPSFREFCYKSFCRVFPEYHLKKTLEYSLRDWERVLSVSDKICLLSDRFFDRLCHYASFIDRKKLIAINNPNSFPVRTSSKKKEREKLFLWVARHENGQKNFPLFIDFWKQFKETHSDWKAIVLGEGVDWEYNKRCAKKKHTEDIEFLGNQQNMPEYYERASFIMMTSFWEGWGMVLTEALSFGCIPCVFDTFESLHDIIDDRVNGVIIPPFNIKAAIEAISEILGNVDMMDKMRFNGLRKVLAFDVSIIVDKWEKIIAGQSI